MRKNKAVLYMTTDNKPVIVAATLVKWNVKVEVYSYGFQSGVYQTKNLNKAILEYTQWQKFSKVIARCPKCFEYIAEQHQVPEHDHVYQCPDCGHQKHISNPEEEV